jgi:hypothetical protein
MNRSRIAFWVFGLLLLTVRGAWAQEVIQPLDHKYAVGARIRGLFVTSAMLAPFVQTTSKMNSMSGGAEFIYRRPTYDVVTSLDLSFINMEDATFLTNGHPPDKDSHYVQFGNFGQLNFLSADVSILGHNWLTSWLEIRYGAGVGLGLVLGDVKTTNNGAQCTLQNLSNGSQCYPKAGTTDIPLGRPDTEAKLQATETGQVDTANSPHRHVTSDKPPVMAVVNILIGLRFKVQRHLAFDVELGFRDAIFAGGSIHYLF